MTFRKLTFFVLAPLVTGIGFTVLFVGILIGVLAPEHLRIPDLRFFFWPIGLGNIVAGLGLVVAHAMLQKREKNGKPLPPPREEQVVEVCWGVSTLFGLVGSVFLFSLISVGVLMCLLELENIFKLSIYQAQQLTALQEKLPPAKPARKLP